MAGATLRVMDTLDADEYVFRIMSDAVGPGSAPWAFYVTGPGGVHEVRR